jgi:hypothetical protein
MKYPGPTHVNKAMETLPAFMLLLQYRTVKDAMEAIGHPDNETATKFITEVETFIFILINIADPDSMEHGLFKIGDPADYGKRRNDLLVSLGLKEYARTTYLLNPNALHPQFRRN